MSNVIQRLKNIFLSIPKNLNTKEALKSSAVVGGLSALAAAILSSKKNKLRNAAIAGVVGSAGGFYSDLVRQNIMREMYGRFSEDPTWYNPDSLLSDVKRKKLDRVLLYVTGAANTPGGSLATDTPDIEADRDRGVYHYAWGDGDKLAAGAKKLISEGIPVDIIAHSAGGTAALDALQILGEDRARLNSVNLLDPVDFNLGRNFLRWLGLLYNYDKDKLNMHIPLTRTHDINIGKVLPEAYKAARDADKWVTNNPLVIFDDLPGANYIVHNDHHGMHTTGLRSHPIRGLSDDWKKTIDMYKAK